MESTSQPCFARAFSELCQSWTIVSCTHVIMYLLLTQMMSSAAGEPIFMPLMAQVMRLVTH